MRHPRNRKNDQAFGRMKVHPAAVGDKHELDKNVFDLVLSSLYNNADKGSLSFEREILLPHNVALPFRERERIWNVMLSSGWVMPGIGFGKAGNLELSRTGYQLMALYGGYSQYLDSVNNPQQQTMLLPTPPAETNELTPGAETAPKQAAQKK